MNIEWLLKKTHAVIVKGPATARNIAFSHFDYWPTRPLANETLRNMPVYCVSMTSATRRRRIIDRQVAQMGLTAFEYVDAIEATGLSRDQIIEAGLYDETAALGLHQRPLRLTEIAGSLSHGIAYERIVARGHPMAMVIEDDALFCPAELDRVDLAALPPGWDIAFLNSFIESGPPRNRIADTLYKGDAYTGSAAAYLVSLQGARILVSGYKPVTHAADGYTGRNDITRLMYYPDSVLNGSVCYYYTSSLL